MYLVQILLFNLRECYSITMFHFMYSHLDNNENINERERGKKAELCEYGFPDDRQFSLKNAGSCPLCESKISNKDILKVIGSYKV